MPVDGNVIDTRSTDQDFTTASVTTGSGSTIDSNNLLAKIEYPDPTTGAASTSAANDVSYTVDSLGETLTMTDQNGSTHTYAMDTLGRETGDSVTTLGSGVNGAVRRRTFSFTAAGLPYQQTSYNAASGGSVVNQDQDAYNGLWQLVAEYQAVNGSVSTSTTPAVQYSYNLMAGGANNSNLRAMTLPDGRILDYDYGQGQEPVTGIAVSGSTATVTTAVPEGLSNGDSVLIGGSSQAALNGTFTITVTSSTTFTYTFTGSASSDTASTGLTETPVGLDTLIGRPDGLQDQAGSAAGTVLQGYQYLGLGTVVQQADGNGTELTYIQQSGDGSAITSGDQYAGDQYTGLDRFGRVIDQNWIDTNTPTPTTTDRFQLNYDQAGNVLYSDNLVTPGNSQLYHASSTTSSDNSNAYDPLARETGFRRGTLSASGNNDNSGAPLDTVSSTSSAAGSNQTFTLDALGNRTNLGSGGSTYNSQNEFITSGGYCGITYDNNGDLTYDGVANHYTYDAWGEMMSGGTSGANSSSTAFAYDTNGRQIIDNTTTCSCSTAGGYVNTTYNATAADEYYSGQQAVEDAGSYNDQAYSMSCTCCCNFSDCCTWGCRTDTYAWGADYVNDLVLRDTTGTVQTWADVNGTITSSGPTALTPLRIYPEHDANFNIRTLTSTSGAVLGHIDYDPWGNATLLNSSYAGTGTAFGSDSYNWIYGFQGGRYDPVTSLYHFGARNYSPAEGRWMQQDPGGYVDGSDLYQMELGDPATLTDAAGLAANPGTISGTPIAGSKGEFISSHGATIVVQAYADAKMTVEDDGKQEKYVPRVAVSARSSDAKKDNCDDLHFIQFLSRDEIRKASDPQNHQCFHASGLWHAPREWYLDSIDNSVFYDSPDTVSIHPPGLTAIGDSPSMVNVYDDHQYVKGEDYVVSNDKVRWLIEWTLTFTGDQKHLFNISVESSAAATSFGAFDTATWLRGYRDVSDDFKKPSNPVTVPNPFFKK